ncbi:MATE family efflux transporter [Photobacterium alginatilyticum]|uniref:MATE family efflux transporter n=1 Tax=Photobacterium alginatilyticum TaxID=1775171 RepID=UPI0040686968
MTITNSHKAANSSLYTLLTLAIPITLQTALFSSKSIIDNLMLGKLSAYDIAAIGFASKAQLVITFFIIGISIGGGQVAAQCWGAVKSDDSKFKKSITIMLLLSFIAAFTFFIPLSFLSRDIMTIGTQSNEIITRGSDYLQIIAYSLFFFAYTSTLATGLRVMHQPMIATVISTIGVCLNIFLNWLLIFGHWGGPAMGIKGAAIGTLISAIIETLCLFAWLLYQRHRLALLPLKLLRAITSQDIKTITHLSMTAATNSIVWALGIFAFHALLGNTDTNLLIALAVLSPIETLSMALLIGLSSAASIIIGNHVGAERYDLAKKDSNRMLLVSIIFGVLTALVLWMSQATIIDLFYNGTSSARALTEQLFTIMVLSIAIKSLSMMFIVGILRAGGDSRFCLYTDIFSQWVFLLPCTTFLAYVLQLDAVLLYSLIIIEESLKILICIMRLRSGKWITNLSNCMS